MGRPCSICRHPDRAEIDSAIASGQPFRNVAERFGLSLAGVSRHQKHIQNALSLAAQARQESQLADAAGLLEELHRSKDSVLRAIGQIEGLAEGPRLAALPGLLAAVKTHCSVAALLLEAEERREQAGARLSDSSEWRRLRGLILSALSPYPPARQAVLLAIQAAPGGAEEEEDELPVAVQEIIAAVVTNDIETTAAPDGANGRSEIRSGN